MGDRSSITLNYLGIKPLQSGDRYDSKSKHCSREKRKKREFAFFTLFPTMFFHLSYCQFEISLDYFELAVT